MRRFLIIGLLIRLILLPLSYHSDLNNNAIWGIYAQEFGLRGFYDWLNFGNYARPDYPPLAMVLFLIIRNIWQALFNFLWFLNVSLPIFPSELIPWFETKGYLSLIKAPGIIADLGISYLIYKFLKSKKMAALFLFNPAVIYLSSSWGQLDSIVSFFSLTSVLLILKKKYFKSLSFFWVSIMIKATYVPVSLALLIQSLLQKIKLKKTITLIGALLIYLFILGSIFIDHAYISWTIDTYIKKILPGAVTLPFINLNAFNFWGLILGLERIPDSTLFAGITLNAWATFISFLLIGAVTLKFIKGQSIFFYISVLYLVLFLFMPRVHERYLYPFFVFFPFVVAKLPDLKKYLYIISAIFLINLYHWWWFPNIGPLVWFFDLGIVERMLSLFNLILFSIILKKYLWGKRYR